MNPDGTVKFQWVIAGAILLGVIVTACRVASTVPPPSAPAAIATIVLTPPTPPVLRFPTNILAPEGWEVRYLQVAPHSCSYLLAKPGVGAAVWVVPCDAP